MKKTFILSALALTLVVSVLAGSASASQITFVSVTGNWHDAVSNLPGRPQGEPAITNGVPTSSINWGVTSGAQSGYDFTRTAPGPQTLPPVPTPFFPLGTFTHRNFPVSDPSLTSVQLDVVLLLNVDGVQTGPLNFTFTFHHEETPNNQSPCPYPTPAGEGCTDRVTFFSSPAPTTFKVGGVDYTLSMSFVDSNGNPVSEFITRENLVNTANLVGQFTLPPPTITNPTLVLRKSGPATMTLGQPGNFGIDVQNTGQGEAWNVSLRDLLPHGANGGMCNLTPAILSAQVFAADGVTPVPGKGPLNQGTDYSFTYNAAPNCQLDINLLTAAGRIGPTERLIVRYRTQLDANTQNGVALTNVAGAIQWFNADSSNPSRKTFSGPLTNGTPGILDNQDAFTVTLPAIAAGYTFDKTVADLTSSVNPAKTAAPGDRLRYTLRFRTTGQALGNFRIFDEMDALNTQADFAPGTLNLISFPQGADASATNNTGGAKGTGVIDIRNLNLAANSEALIQFDITLKQNLTNGAVVTNQATLFANGTPFAWSDDPNVNGTADPTVAGGEDPTRVTITTAPTAPSFQVLKISTYLGNPNFLLPGDTMRYTITVKNVSSVDATNVMLRDTVPANTAYVAGSTTLNGATVADVAAVSPLANGMLIDSPANPVPGLMPAAPANGQSNIATITFDVVVNPNTAGGTVISNQGFVSGSGFVDQPSDDPRTPTPNDPTRDTVATPGGPGLLVSKSGPATLSMGQWGNFSIDIRNTGPSDAWNSAIRDFLPHIATGGMCNLTPEILSAQVFAADGVTPVSGKGPLNRGTDYSLGYSAAPNCQLDIKMLTAGGTIGPNQRLIIRYRTQLDANTQNGVDAYQFCRRHPVVQCRQQ